MTTVAQVGVRGFGRIHLERIDRLVDLGRITLAATADPGGPPDGRDVPWYEDLGQLLPRHDVDIVSIATPIGTHAALSTAAMRAGAHVMLEKPPVASLTEFWRLLRTVKETGRAVQVGFQSLGSAGVARMRELLMDGTLGEVTAINARGAWVRDRAYYGRAAWAGKRTVRGERVADGVATNPLAHAIATALAIARTTGIDDLVTVTTEMYHAHDIEADDTSFVRIDLADGPPICAALTLCATEQVPPTVSLVGTRGTAEFSYTTDELTLTVDGTSTHEAFGRTDLLENLVDHLSTGQPLLVPLDETVGFTCVLEATQDRSAPRGITPHHVTWVGEDDGAHPVVAGIEHWLDEALRTQRGFAAAGAPWADAAAVETWYPRHSLAELALDGAVVAEYSDGSDIIPTSSPRPYLHPIRTLSGVRISESHPADHDWHCGLSFTMQDVNGVNFWGGRTYVRDRGYTWLGDQGAIRHARWIDRSPQHLEQELRWCGPIVDPLEHPIEPVELVETRRLDWWRDDERTWVLDADLHLASPTGQAVTLGGPGTNGRDVGYGGWQLRLRHCVDARVFGPGFTSADEVFGRTAPWVGWTATIDGRPVTVGMGHHDTEAEASDRWFVRQGGEWNGIGTALAWSEVVPVPLRRRYRLVVADGTLTADRLATLLRP
ncbi:MAG TPA: Gfo/Idh/MocA family oxidoreductase [Propionibacterium sp.]|nr:Gfo/Idh/MocA family oxidoreductase [Propionibacterium sp.]